MGRSIEIYGAIIGKHARKEIDQKKKNKTRALSKPLTSDLFKLNARRPCQES